MFFNSYSPCAQLAPYIRTYWILEQDANSGHAETIIPDGCMELIFHYGDEFVSNIANVEEKQSDVVIVGQIKQAITIQPTGKTGIISVRFQPWGFYALTGVDAKKITEQVIDADALWGRDIDSLKHQLLSASHNNKVQLIEQFLLQRLLRQKSKTIENIQYITPVIGLLTQHNGNIPIAHLAYQSNMSVRNFNRKVSDITGLSPKHLARIIRLQSFLSIHSQQTTLTDSLYKSGYYDQAHFIRDFKEIACSTPQQFFDTKHQMAELMWQ